MHTGVVALSHMDPTLLATVLHNAFASGIELNNSSRVRALAEVTPYFYTFIFVLFFRLCYLHHIYEVASGHC